MFIMKMDSYIGWLRVVDMKFVNTDERELFLDTVTVRPTGTGNQPGSTSARGYRRSIFCENVSYYRKIKYTKLSTEGLMFDVLLVYFYDRDRPKVCSLCKVPLVESSQCPKCKMYHGSASKVDHKYVLATDEFQVREWIVSRYNPMVHTDDAMQVKGGTINYKITDINEYWEREA